MLLNNFSKSAMLIFNLFIFSAVTCKKQYSLCKVRKDNKLKSILSEIIVQNKAKGFTGFYQAYDKSEVYVQYARKELLTQLTKITTFTCINKKMNSEKYFIIENRLGKHLDSCLKTNSPKCKCMNQSFCTNRQILATDSILLVYVISGTRNLDQAKKAITSNINHLMLLLSTVQSSPKVLFISIASKSIRSNYSEMLRYFAEQNLINLDILEISTNCCKRKISFNYKVHQYNFYKNQFRQITYKPGVIQWFPDKTKGFYGKQLRVRYRAGTRRTVERRMNDLNVPYVYLKAVVEVLNVSVEFNAPKTDWYFYHTTFCSIYKGQTHVKLDDYWHTRLMIPVFYSTVRCSNMFVILSNLTVSFLIIAIFWSFARICDFDKDAWSPATILEMVFGDSTARVSNRAPERALLICIIAIGFFFGSDLMSGLTFNAFNTEVPDELKTFEDLRSHNITAYLLTPVDYSLYYNSQFKDILNSKVKVRAFEKYPLVDLLRNMLYFKNTSISLAMEREAIIFPEKIKVEKKIYAEKSNLMEMQLPLTTCLRRRDAFLHRASDLYWRASECFLKAKPMFRKTRLVSLRKLTVNYEFSEKSIYELLREFTTTVEQENFEDKSLSFEIELIYFYALAVLPLTALIVEKILHKYAGNYSNQ